MSPKKLREDTKDDKFKVFSLSQSEKEALLEQIRRELLEDKNILFAYVYGSLIDEPFFRDIDIAVYLKDYNENSWKDYELNLAIELEKKLGFNYPIDLRILNDAQILYSYRVINGKLLFSTDEEIWSDYVIRTLKLHDDFYPFWYAHMIELIDEYRSENDKS